MPPRPPRRDRPAPTRPDAAAGPGVPLRWRWFRGWPEGLDFDEDVARRASFEMQRESIKRELQDRFTRTGGSVGRVRSWHAASVSLSWLVPWMLYRLAEPWLGGFAQAIYLPVMTLVAIAVVQVAIARLWRPRWRAALRRERIDCCVRCGQRMARGVEADRCPECGFDHAEFPLGWGPGRLRPGRIAATTAGPAAAPADPTDA